MKREEILTGRVRVGKTASYEIADHSKHLKMVSFIDRGGKVMSANYAHLHIACATDREIELEFTRHRVMIKGANLAEISRAIAAHRLVYVREDSKSGLYELAGPFIKALSFTVT